MVQVVMQNFYPKRGVRPYTLLGFRRSVRKRLLQRGFTRAVVDRLEALYFGRGLWKYMDDTASYRNVRKSRLYCMSRGLKVDRKRFVFEPVLRSGLFVCYLDEEGNMLNFYSPYCQRVGGMILM